jgi:hypothetical protein
LIAVRSTAHYLVCVFHAIWIWNLKFECIVRSLFLLSVCLSRRFFVLDGKMVDFAGHFCIVLAFSALENDVDEALSSWKMDAWLWNKEKASILVIFGTSMMILQ